MEERERGERIALPRERGRDKSNRRRRRDDANDGLLRRREGWRESNWDKRKSVHDASNVSIPCTTIYIGATWGEIKLCALTPPPLQTPLDAEMGR